MKKYNINKDKIKRLFFPKRCVLCGKIVPIERDYCSCAGDTYVTVSDDFCPHCGADKENCVCKENGEIVFEHITAPFYYSGLAKIRLLELKFLPNKNESIFFAGKMSYRFAEAFSDAKIDFVTFVPMTKTERENRGFNQSQLLAQGVAENLFLTCKSVLLKKGESAAQHSLTQKERMKNLEDCFKVPDEKEVFGKTILLCDDIKTTGTTLNRCLDVLFKAGAKDIYCLCAAITDYAFPF
ncbi:MAG: ComF family protein [Acutalibacteraceae bacterium]